MSSGVELIVSDSEVCLIFSLYHQKKERKGKELPFPECQALGRVLLICALIYSSSNPLWQVLSALALQLNKLMLRETK